MFKGVVKRSQRKKAETKHRRQVRELRRSAVQLERAWAVQCQCCSSDSLWEWHFELRQQWKDLFASK